MAVRTHRSAGLRRLMRRRGDRVADLEQRLAAATQALAEHRHLAERVINSVDVGLLALDADGAYQMVNRQHETNMELTRPDGHPRTTGDHRYLYAADGVTRIPDEEVPSARAAAGEALRDVLVWAGSDPDQRRAFAVSASPHHDHDGSFAGTVLAYKEVTELVRALRVKDEFVANVSHELRTPLTSIIGYVDLLLDDLELTDDVRGHLEIVQRNSHRLHRLVDDLLSTALGSAAAVHDAERVRLTALVESSASEATHRASAAGVHLQIEAGRGHDLAVQGDAQRLLQVFDNLLSNAVKYTEAGGTVTVTVVRDGTQAVVRIADSGRGIDSDELALVFERFYRCRSAHTDAVQGIGLGLAITKSIVESHGGTIMATSDLGRGSTFEVRLPLAAPWPVERLA